MPNPPPDSRNRPDTKLIMPVSPALSPAGVDDATFRHWTAAVTDQLRDVSYGLERLVETQTAYAVRADAVIEKLERIVAGNSRPEEGLAFRLKLLENAVLALDAWRKQQDEAQSLRNRVIGVILGAMALAVGTALWAGIKALAARP